MKAPLNLCLLFSLISPVVLLKCKMCSNPSGTTCPKAIDGNCTSDFSCRNYIFDSNVLLNMSIAIKSCTPSERCDPGYYSLTTSGGGFIKMLVDCCTTYNCNSRDLEFSSEPMEPNGLQCEGCHVKDRGMCKGAEMVKCLGDQTKCISMKIMSYKRVSNQGREFTTKGCATPLMCDQRKLNNNMHLGTTGMTKIKANCTDAILSPEPSSLA